MAKVGILSRQLYTPLGSETDAGSRVAVTYSLEFKPPYSIYQPIANYREATGAELVANARLAFYPHGQAQQDAELQAIRQDIDARATSAPPTFDLP